MNLVTQANPYNPEPIDDDPDHIQRMVELQAAGTPYQSELSSLAGRWYTEFVHEVNDAKEERELALVELHVSFTILARDERIDVCPAATRSSTATAQVRM